MREAKKITGKFLYILPHVMVAARLGAQILERQQLDQRKRDRKAPLAHFWRTLASRRVLESVVVGQCDAIGYEPG